MWQYRGLRRRNVNDRNRRNNPYEIGLDKNAANFVPLTPLGFLSRSAAVFPDRRGGRLWRAPVYLARNF